ncbi:inhibitor of nuclear factor kappa-B kinase subunit epsilon [Culicoides brevitarsis]|uniref:inhibitor of nuclear factor kappa-B kinase subunit epsilon n=1 Tax=Culicoides brevitarsis TaxID=469753 RepID=UPI00307C64AA
MSLLRGSLNYVWCTTSVLGKGATGAVFQGVNKHNGEAVAVKTFNQVSHMRPYDVQMREFEVLQKVKHKNIVKLLAIEDDQEGRGKVIVMELCTGGSLFNILDDPENTYGLSEKEFLLVLEHLTAGMKHLRDNNLVHRDLKPGNIMKYLSEDGQTIYKLTDFGAARELDENQQFVSLYGTEEYLHPDMYERAVLRKPINRSFTANVDLWSIGVTLYHVATGNLPFRPFGGRKNKETMHQITTKKQPGVISGIQTTENGPIEWSRQLPPHCQLTTGLKYLVTPLLAGLLEESQKRMWSFDRFFNEVTNILTKRVLHFYYINKATSIEVYMDPDESLDNLKEHLRLQTEVQPQAQLLLLDHELLEDRVGANSSVRGYPETSELKPIMLYSIDNNNVSLPTELDLPKFPSFSSAVTVEADASLAKVACSVGHEIRRRIETFTKIDELNGKGVKQFTKLLHTALAKLLLKSQHLDDLGSTVIDLADSIDMLIDTNLAHIEEFKQAHSDLMQHNREFTRISEAILQLHNRCIIDDSITREWQTLTRTINGPLESRSNFRAKHLVDRLRDSWQHLLRDRATRSLTYNDEQFHALEKIKAAEVGKRIKSLLADDVRPAIHLQAEALADWYKMAQTLYLQTQILQKDVIVYEESVLEIKEVLLRLRKKVKTSQTQSADVKNGPQSNNYGCDLNVLSRNLLEIKALLQQNGELVETIRNISFEDVDEMLNSMPPDNTRL